MSDVIKYIPKTPLPKPGQDYELLRAEGIKRIEKLSHMLWTDYNVHDPGITILEALCYAITDIGYRADYDIKDLLAGGDPAIEHKWFTARDILTCSPLTANDYRKLLIDIEGVKNAWIHRVKDTKPAVYIDCKQSKLSYEQDDDHPRMHIRGLYNVTLELDEDPVYGDLNEYTFSEELGEHRMLIQMPDWAKLFAANVAIDLKASSSLPISVSYLGYNAGSKQHKISVEVTDGSDTHVFPASFSWDGPTDATTINQLKGKLSNTNPFGLLDIYVNRLDKALKVACAAYDKLHQNRTLCEDYQSIKGIDVEDISVCANIEVTADANIEEVLAELYFRLRQYLSPSVNFYDLEEMYEAGLRSEQIFSGPILDHGFIKDEDLKAAELRTEVRTSDIVQIIMDIKGVKAVRKILIAGYEDGLPITESEKWLIDVKEGLAPRLSIDKSKITFYKDKIPYYAKSKESSKILNKMLLQERAQKLGVDVYDIEIEEGTNRNAGDYYSFQNEFPLTYGIGKKGIPGMVDDKRLAQAKQLKGFLLVFDQLLANYMAQLSQMKSLFSFDKNVKQSYFYELLYRLPDSISSDNPAGSSEDLPGIYKVLSAFAESLPGGTDIDAYKTYKADWESFKADLSNDYVTGLAGLVEDQETFETRRNQFLDHLMARFGEQFTDYVLLSYQLDEEKAASELIEDKISFLADYDKISYGRALAMTYQNCHEAVEVWDSENVSGFTKRIARLAGIVDYSRHQLHCLLDNSLYTTYKDGNDDWAYKYEKNGILLFKEGIEQEDDAKDIARLVQSYGIDENNYRKRTSSSTGKYYFLLHSSDGTLLGSSPKYDSMPERDDTLAALLELLDKGCSTEGLHLVEHLLLRPRYKDDPLIDVCIENACNDCLGILDPYSFRMSLMMPAWPKRFQSVSFRAYFEQMVRLEAPAHIHVKICWLDNQDMSRFETAWKKWLQLIAAEGSPDKAALATALEQLLKVMNEVKSVYPVATLHDCDEGEDENPVLLNNSILGSSKFK